MPFAWQGSLGPAGPNGLRDASKDRATIERWFQPTSINIGIATGAVSGIVVLDIDPRHGADEIHCCPPLAEAEVAITVRSIARREISRREGRHEP